MKKTPSLFKRDYEGNRQVINEVVPGSEWVQNGEGVATRKYDGTPVAYIDGAWYKRYDVKKGRTAPEVGIPCEEAPDPNSGHWPWWVPVGDDRWINEAIQNTDTDHIANGTTFEAVGPKINGNREEYDIHLLLRHGDHEFPDCPTDFDGLRDWLTETTIEGIVWHHPDGRMVKIKRKDFGLKW